MKTIILIIITASCFSCTSYKIVQYKTVYLGNKKNGAPILKRVSKNKIFEPNVGDTINVIYTKTKH